VLSQGARSREEKGDSFGLDGVPHGSRTTNNEEGKIPCVVIIETGKRGERGGRPANEKGKDAEKHLRITLALFGDKIGFLRTRSRRRSVKLKLGNQHQKHDSENAAGKMGERNEQKSKNRNCGIKTTKKRKSDCKGETRKYILTQEQHKKQRGGGREVH